MSISKHISYKEGVYSRTATRLGIKNNPNTEQMENMITIAEEVFEPLRAYVGGPIKINSFFRSPDTFGRCTNAEMFEFIKKYLDFDQIIWEFGNDNNPDWVHVSYVSPDQNRKRCLKAYKEKGKTNYKII